MNKRVLELLEGCPIIAAVKNEDGLQKSLRLDNSVIFILYGDICSIAAIVEQVKAAGKTAIVHTDLITGLSAREEAADFIKQYTTADGIISTRPNIIRRAKELSLLTVLRVFVIDSMALRNLEKEQKMSAPHVIEILPGVMPKVLKRICTKYDTPVIAGGLINDKDDIMSALQAGAVSISTTNEKVWSM